MKCNESSLRVLCQLAQIQVRKNYNQGWIAAEQTYLDQEGIYFLFVSGTVELNLLLLFSVKQKA